LEVATMLKTVTCALSTIRRAATDKGVSLAVDGWYESARPGEVCDHGMVDAGTPDVHARTLKDGTVAVRGGTLEGDLFLSLLVAGAI
jgi:hypothetical protein